MKIKKFETYTQDELMNDLDNNEFDIESGEEFDSSEWQIDSIIDIITDDPTKSEEEVLDSTKIEENAVTFDMSVPRDISRGDYVWVTALIKKKNANFNNPGRQAVIKLRVTEIYYGLAHLNKVINQ